MASPSLLPVSAIRTVGLAGAGAVGYGWAALLLARGYTVAAFDPAPEAEDRLRAAVIERWPALLKMNLAVGAPDLAAVSFFDSAGKMAAICDLVQENAPENHAVKGQLLSEIDAALPPDRLILSSSGGMQPSDMQAFCRSPHRVLVGHPFHPAHIVPLVEIVGGKETSPEAIELAIEFYRGLGKKPIRLKREMVAHLANRLQFALLREATYCLAEGVASASDIDGALRWGLGPRWALMGGLMTFNLAGGDGGMESLLDRFGDDVQHWWDALGETQLTPEVKAALVEGARELTGNRSNQEWAAWRDAALIAFASFAAEHPLPVGAQDGAVSEIDRSRSIERLSE